MTELMDLLAAQRDPAERIGVFAESLHAEESPALRELERTALENGIPIIRPHTRGLIQCILEMKAPERILEIGTATGYSALVMYTYSPAPCEIITIEREAERAAQARQNFERFGAERIQLLEGDAAQILPELIRLLPPGGILLTDNCLKEGEILESKFAVTRRNRTIHKRMREYLTAISSDERLRTVLLETGDGAAISVRRREKI